MEIKWFVAVILYFSQFKFICSIHSNNNKYNDYAKLETSTMENDINIIKVAGNYTKDGGYSNTFKINRTTEYIIIFPTSNSVYPYRVRIRTIDLVSYNNPLLVVVRQEKEVLSWQVPFLVETSKKGRPVVFWNTSRTLCHNSIELIKSKFGSVSHSGLKLQSLVTNISQDFIVSLSTSHERNMEVQLDVEEEKKFYILENDNITITVSPSQPRYFYYEIKKDESDTLIIQVDSADDVCLTVSVQDSSCPVMDLNSDITYEGQYQTINRKGALTIRKSQFNEGFFVVFVAKADNYDCSQEHSVLPILRSSNISTDNRTSSISFVIRKSISSQDYLVASLVTVCTITIFCFVSIFMICAFKRWGSLSKISKTDGSILVLADDLHDDTNPISGEDIDNYLKQTKLTVKNLAKYPLKDKRRSFNYMWHILSIAIFYSIPVVQLVITYQRVVNQTGNQDMCYFNFMCAHPAFGFSDFNHIFSNIGYCVIGFFFLFVILHRHLTVPSTYEIGIPVHYGLFYAMGIALVIEGLLSACYHICPSQSNYQFDTSFMYVMAVLCLIKLYQNRHPDINATAYATFTVLGGTIFFAMVGILNGTLAIWIGFIVIYSMLCIYISCKIYFFSFVLKGITKFKDDLSEQGFTKETFAPIKRGRFILLLMANLINYAILIAGLLVYSKGSSSDFGTFLLGLLMGNSILYAIFYTSMKLIHKERICIEAIVYGLLAVASWVAATIFFIDAATLWTVTPAESRQSNQECILMNFYDKHDVWHLLSAPALYFSFMFLLCLDDDLVDRRQDEIVVF